MELLKQKNENKIDCILIDDCELNRSNWEIIGKLNKRKVSTFFSVDEFYAEIENFEKTVEIYIDSNLADAIKGEEAAKEIFKKGFNNIYLCTGDSKNDFPEMSWIKDIVDKVPPFLRKKS